MADLTANTPRNYGKIMLQAAIPVKASTHLYEGMAIGEDSSNGTADLLAASDSFLGFALREADNSSGSAGDIDVKLAVKGLIELTVTGGAQNTLGAAVYATDSNTFSTTDSGSDTQIGTIYQQISGTKVLVYFQGYQARDV